MVTLVEATERVEQLLGEEQTRARECRVVERLENRRVAGGDSSVDVKRSRVGREPDTGVLNCPVGIEEAAAHRADAGVTLGCGHEPLEPARERDRVVVEEDDVLAARSREPLVAGRPEAEVLRIEDRP